MLPKSQLTDEGAFSLLKNVPMKLKYLFVGSAIEKPPITITVQDFDGDISKRTLVWKAHEAIEKNEIYFEGEKILNSCYPADILHFMKSNFM